MGKLKRKEYRAALKPLQRELIGLARWASVTGERIVVLFEGRDSAGKGGVIKAIREHLNPRQCRVVALAKPSDRECGQWYFQRYVAHLPAAGEMVFFDRSWYNRAGVERVMEFCSPEQYTEFLKQAPAFEKMLIDHALRRNQGSVSAVMTELALPRRTLNEKMAKYGLSRQDYL